jgi:hypothetical protein
MGGNKSARALLPELSGDFAESTFNVDQAGERSCPAAPVGWDFRDIGRNAPSFVSREPRCIETATTDPVFEIDIRSGCATTCART